jgi:maltooligosyltrehalose trehalohydrolase
MIHPEKNVGAFLAEDGVCHFTVWAPLAHIVEVITTDNKNEKKYSLIKDELGYWSTTVDKLKQGSTYLFQLNGEKRLPDPASRSQVNGVHGPSSLVPTDFSWNDDSWKGLPLSQMIIYELHTGTFSNAGDFNGIISRLSYLRDLGINAIELMPVAQFPGKRNWGYDGVFPFAVHHDYGGATCLKQLVDEAHRHGLAVVLDVVYNHQGPEGNYLSEYGPYFTDKYKTGWGRAINFDDAWCDGVRSFYWQNALMWLDEFHIDALRLDAVHAIWDSSAKHFIDELSKKVRKLEKKTGKKKILIAEFDLNNPRYINPPEEGGYGLDGQWIDEFHHALHSLATGEVNGYYEDFGTLSHLAKSLKHSYVYTGQYSKHRKKFFGREPVLNTYDQFVVFAQNHDQIGNRMLGDRLTTHLSFEGLKLIAATVLLAPQVPLLFMGEEYGETNPFQYFISHTDAELVTLVREGRKKEFSYFNWEGEVPDPYAQGTFDQCKLSWNFSAKTRTVLLSYYKYLIAFRKKRLAMQGRKSENLDVFEVPGHNALAIKRSFESDNILIVANFEKQPVSITHPHLNHKKKIFDSSSAEWIHGDDVPPAVSIEDDAVLMNPESILIFEM